MTDVDGSATPKTSSTLPMTDVDGSGDQTKETFPETSSVTAKSSLYSTEKPTSESPETQEPETTSQTGKLSATPETNATLPTTDDDGSGDQTKESFPDNSSVTAKSSLYSTEAPTRTSPVISSASSPSISGSTMKPETASFSITTDSEGSGDSTEDLTQDSLISATTVSSFAASSLYSTEKPTSESPETQEPVTTSQTGKLSATPKTSSTLPTTDEDGSVDQTKETFPETSSVTAKSSLFTTGAPTRTTPVTSFAVSDIDDKVQEHRKTHHNDPSE
ncbi:uncharacterized protein [Cebidichthys violaceus]|uniref:uncharacterized protein n=1 Tax=Cebidichthys violaceus TaxID=271503 RepID=UPI0035C9AE22